MRTVKITWVNGVVTETTIGADEFVGYISNLPMPRIAKLDLGPVA
jgi:hypothetical protein